MTCHVVSALHAFRCPAGHGVSLFVRLVVVHGRIVLRVVGRTA